MSKIKIYNMEGKAVGEHELSKDAFGVKVNEGLVHLAAEAASANARTSNQHTKTRGEVRGGGKKPWKQKGTGRARHGSSRSPIWVGGGITFGPRSDRNYSKKINKSSRKAALSMVLSDKAAHEGIIAMNEVTLKEGKTKAMAALLKNLPVGRRVILVLPKSDAMVIRASRNLKNLRTNSLSDVSLMDLLKADTLIAPVATLEAWESKFRKKAAN